jgi:hypothetical protein
MPRRHDDNQRVTDEGNEDKVRVIAVVATTADDADIAVKCEQPLTNPL